MTTNRKNRKWLKVAGIGFLVLIVLVIIGATQKTKQVANSSLNSAAGNSTSQGSTSQSSSQPKINQPADDGKFQFTVTSIKCGQPSVSSSDGYLTKTAQGQYCLLNITANNIGSESQTLDSTSQYLYDSSNKKYSSDSEATTDISPTDNTFFNPINPGNSVSGTVVFDIPKGITPVTAELHDSAFSNGVKVSLQ